MCQVVEGFRQRFPNKDNTTGRTDMWPSQALETYQCKDPSSRASCPSNPSTDIAGLMAVLPRLIALPDSAGVTAAQRAGWAAQLKALPKLPIEKASKPSNGQATKVAATESVNTLGGGSPYTPKRSNSENTQLYPVHPFRVFGTGKAGLGLAQQTYLERPSPCNDGWHVQPSPSHPSHPSLLPPSPAAARWPSRPVARWPALSQRPVVPVTLPARTQWRPAHGGA